jgi:hypothetical protein
LLVDSEDKLDLVSDCIGNNGIIWEHLRFRDQWEQPNGVKMSSVFVMVRSMENWLLADPDGLKKFFGPMFLISAINKPVESIDRSSALAILEKATENCANPYKKGVSSYGALAYLNPQVLAEKCPSFKHFIDCLPI